MCTACHFILFLTVKVLFVPIYMSWTTVTLSWVLRFMVFFYFWRKTYKVKNMKLSETKIHENTQLLFLMICGTLQYKVCIFTYFSSLTSDNMCSIFDRITAFGPKLWLQIVWIKWNNKVKILILLKWTER